MTIPFVSMFFWDQAVGNLNSYTCLDLPGLLLLDSSPFDFCSGSALEDVELEAISSVSSLEGLQDREEVPCDGGKPTPLEGTPRLLPSLSLRIVHLIEG